jgi:hypothetical protein
MMGRDLVSAAKGSALRLMSPWFRAYVTDSGLAVRGNPVVFDHTIRQLIKVEYKAILDHVFNTNSGLISRISLKNRV